jgi:hypothetical protein
MYEDDIDALVWRLVYSNVATLSEIDSTYSLHDIITAIDILDEQAEIEKQNAEKLKRK